MQHAGDPPGREIGIALSLSLDGVLRLEVADACTALPRARATAPDPDSESGRGLLLVTALATDWGVTPRPYNIGKTTWAELKLTAACA